jgi:hypothetical protein
VFAVRKELLFVDNLLKSHAIAFNFLFVLALSVAKAIFLPADTRLLFVDPVDGLCVFVVYVKQLGCFFDTSTFSYVFN